MEHRRPQPERAVPLSAAISDDTLAVLALQRSEIPTTVSPSCLRSLMETSMRRRTPLAGCAFENQSYWSRLCPETSGGRWAAAAGVDFPITDKGPQRRARLPPDESRPEMRVKVQQQVALLEKLGVAAELSPAELRHCQAAATHDGTRIFEYVSPVFALPKPNKPDEDRFLQDLKVSGANECMIGIKHRQDGPETLKSMVLTSAR